MKKRIFAVAAVSAMVLGAFTGCGNRADIGRDAALEVALSDAGVNESDTTRLTVSEDRDDGRKTYDVKFDAAGKEYDYEIQASDGRILSSDIENIEGYVSSQTTQENSAGNAADSQSGGNAGQGSADDQNNAGSQSSTGNQANAGDQSSAGNQSNTGSGNTSGQNNSGTVSQGTQQGNGANVAISQDQAVQIALERVPGATEQNMRIKLDYDDGRYVYEGEIRYNYREYDFEIDANSGTILEWSEERD